MLSMTASELRDRLDDRFRLLVGSRRGLSRHQTLRHAVAWSHDLLDDTEKTLLARCSVFAGGFDLAAACAVGGCGDDLATLDVLDALVRKSLLVADRPAGRTRFSMLETIRQFAEEQLVARGEATAVRTAHACHFAHRITDIQAVWGSPRQREAYIWFSAELANLRTAFRWAADLGDLDAAASIATYASFLGIAVESFEPLAWAEVLIDPARAAHHEWLAALSVMASQCWITGRFDDAARYANDADELIGTGLVDELPFGDAGLLPAAFMASGQIQRALDWYEAQFEQGRRNHVLTRIGIVLALLAARRSGDAVVATNGLIDAAERTDNPYVLSFALFTCGYALIDADHVGALEALRRGMAVAHYSGNSAAELRMVITLARVQARYGDPLQAFDYIALAIRKHHDSGNTTSIRHVLAVLAALLHRNGRHEPAATIAGFAVTPFVRATFPETDIATDHLRDVLGKATYESLARVGESMTTSAMVTYVYDQIDQARTELNAVSE